MLVRRTWKTLSLAAVLVVAASCSVLGLDDADAERLDRERRAWSQLGIHDYTLNILISCFCPPDMTKPLIATVHSDSLVSLVLAENGEAVPKYQPVTVPELFALVEDAIESDQDDLLIKYDREYHFPILISFHRENALDSGMKIQAGPIEVALQRE